MSMSIKKGDKVEVLSGKDRGKQGVVLRALPSEGKVIVEGVAVVKPNGAGQQGGIVDKEMPIDVSNVQLICPECGKRTRVGHEAGELDGHKTKLRICKKCGHKF
jgi:large subunit ribosomal protein L24